jgi:amino acid permease
MKKINMTEFNNINLGEFHFNKIIKSIGICLFIFCYQSKIFKVYLSLRRRNNIEMKNSVHFGILSSILLISFIGFSNSFNIKNNNFEDLIDKLFYDYNNYVSIFLKILIIIQLIFFMILSSFYLITSSIYLKKKINSLIKDYSNKYIIELEKTDNEKKLKEEEIDKRILIIDVIIFVFYIFFTLYFKNISSIIYLIGILSSNCLSILLPSFFFLFLKKEKFFGSKYLLEKLNLVIGFFLIISSVILFFLNFRNKEKIKVNPKK